MWRIGLTGGIGSGKSTVARLLVGHGAELIDTDAIALELTQAGGAAIPQVACAFGNELIDQSGALDRHKMRQLVFSDSAAKRTLEGILHPLIREQALTRASGSSAPLLVFDVPLLTESRRWREHVDQVWVVDCLEETQIERVLRRPGWTAATVKNVLRSQATRAQRRACADVVLFNDGLSLEALAQLVETTLVSLRESWPDRFETVGLG
jgi:dephospho-CoA kinase